MKVRAGIRTTSVEQFVRCYYEWDAGPAGP